MVKVLNPHNCEGISGTLDGLTFRNYGERQSVQLPRRNVKRPLTERRKKQIGYFTDTASLFRVMCGLRAEYRRGRIGRPTRPEQIITAKELFNGMKGEDGGIYQYWQSVAATWDYVSLRTYNEDYEASPQRTKDELAGIASDTFAGEQTWTPTLVAQPSAPGAIILLIDQLIKRDFRRNTDAFGDRFGRYQLRRIGG